jgi:aerobic carbon-monoxide dehydrogenase large subunit
MNVIGRSIPRIEDRPLLLGQGRFAADISFPGELYMRVVRSPVAHGLLLGIDSRSALSLPLVHAVWTHQSVAGTPPIDFRQVIVPGLEPYRQPVLAQSHVRYVGEPIAAVFALSQEVAEDAADLVFADVDELPPLLNAIDEPREFLPGLSSEAAIITKVAGDVEATFSSANRIIEIEVAVGRQSGTPIETRGAVARLNRDTGVLEIYGAAKIPHINRRALAAMLGLALDKIHLFEGHVGGGFGIRGELYPEDVLVALAALRLGRPVKWVEDRREHLLAANHSRDQHYRLRAAVDHDGRIIGLDAELWHDQGAYVRTHAATVPDLGIAMLPGPYRVPAFRGTAHVRLTNKTPAGTYRGPARFESTLARERLIDAIAAELGKASDEVRHINLIPKHLMPYDRGFKTLGTPLILDSGDYAGLLARFHEHFDTRGTRERVARRRAAGEAVGFGYAFFLEKSGLGPFEGARVTLEPDGTIEIVTGTASLGQGVETVLAQISAETLGAPMSAFRVIHGQTDRISEGCGSFASRATAMAGPAVAAASERLKDRILEVAAVLLQRPAATLTLASGLIVPADGTISPSLTLAEAASGANKPLTEEQWFRAEEMNYPYGIHGAVVAVDTETGAVRVEQVVIAYDVGRAINPMLICGQLAGGMAQGVGGALLEEFRYDDNGQPLSVTFADYLVPTAAEVPPLDILITEDAPSPVNPLGVKGAGEGGLTGIGAAIASAIDDAIGQKVAVRRLPVNTADLHRILKVRDSSRLS